MTAAARPAFLLSHLAAIRHGFERGKVFRQAVKTSLRKRWLHECNCELLSWHSRIFRCANDVQTLQYSPVAVSHYTWKSHMSLQLE